jgi:putative nucleotidyltransferase with HDIG domain
MNRSALASPDQGAIGQAVHWGKLIYVADYQRWPEAIPAYREQGLCSLVAIPVRRQGKVESVVVFYSLSPVTLKEEQLTVARNFVKRLEHALERADTLREVEATREATFRSLGLMLEYRDFETKGHTDRVVALSLRFGKALRLEVRLLEALRWGAYLHDIGKVAIADKILLKPSKLTPEEFEAVKRHPLYGVEICRDIPFLPTETRQIVRSHHERWDGAGYPDGLVGNEIPLLARLFSLVDVYDALISVRPYKPAWSKAEACLELRRQAGHQFDPELTRRFLRLIETGR